MTTTRLIVVTFNNPIKPWEVSKFRGGVIQKVGVENEWFHNHNNDETANNKFHYRYPLIQYRYAKGLPQLICIQNGVEEVQQLFAKADWEIQIGHRKEKLSIKDLKLKQIEVAVTENLYHYQLQHWLPFNTKNYKAYQKIKYEVERIQFLEKLLTGHILAFAEGINWQITEQLTVRLQEIVKTKFVTYKAAKMMAFNINFAVNARLPFQAALGQGVSLGFGVLNALSRLRKTKS